MPAEAVTAKRFQKIYVEIGNVCNLQCSFCPEVDRQKAQMEEDQLRRTLREVKSHTERVCFHVMGEPLNHPLFSRFVAVAGEEGVSLEITTNGTLLGGEKEEALFHPAVAQVNLSLQSFFDNFPSADPETYLRKIFAFCQRALRERPDLYVNLRLWNLPPGSSEDSLNERLLLRIEQEFGEGIKVNRRVDSRLRKSKRLTGRLYLHYDTRFAWPDPAAPEGPAAGRCWGTRSHLAILTEGTVVPCCLDKEARLALGDLEKQTFADILAGTRLNRMKQGFENNQLTEELCRRCTFARRFSV